MSSPTAEVVICGAGIAGIAAAYHLAVRRGVRGVVLVDEGAPLSLTSDKSTECYRNWWPGPGDDMVALMNRSIDLLEELARESGNRFLLNRRGYLFVTADPAQVPMFIERARDAAQRGVGPARIHATASSDYRPAAADSFEDQPTGTDVIIDPTLLRRHFPHLASDTLAVLHARRCGWFSAQQLGMYLLERAREHGVRFVSGRVERVETSGGRVSGVRISARGEDLRIAAPRFVNAAGPFVGRIGRLLGLDLPVFCERHAKVAFNDVLGAVPRGAPMTIWTDPITLPWSDEERQELLASAEHKRLVEEFPAGVHGRPEGGGDSPVVLLIWTYDIEPVEPTFPIEFDSAYGEICLRGMSRMIPGLSQYLTRRPACSSTAATTRRRAKTDYCRGPCRSRGRTFSARSRATGSCPRTAPPISWPITSPAVRCRATRGPSRCRATTIPRIARSSSSGATRGSSSPRLGSF